MSKLGDISYITKLAGFEHTEYIQGNCSHIRDDFFNTPLFIGKTVREGKIDKNYDWYISKELSDKLPRSQLTKRCLVLPYVGSVGDLAVFENDERCHLGSNIAKVELNENCNFNIYFLYYFIKSPYGQKLLFRDIQGAVQKNVTMEAIRDIELPDLSLERQNNIVKVLKTLDDKVETNNKINVELESMAKTVYDYWFLQFEFPNEEGKPYKSSGGKMVYNEELKREIPEEWEVKNIKELCDITWGQCPDGDNILPLDTKEESILYCSGAGDMRNGLLVDCQARTNASRRYANKNDVLMSVAGSIGAFAIVDEKISLGRAAMAFSSKKCSILFTYITVKTLVERMKQVASGSIQKVINDNHINEMNVPYNKEVFEKFNKYNFVLNQQIRLSKENKELSSLRDFLLPLLMNGQAVIN